MPDSTFKMMREIRAMGWTAQFTNGGHIKCTHPDAAWPVFTGATPSDRRAMMAMRTQMQQALKAGRAPKKPG